VPDLPVPDAPGQGEPLVTVQVDHQDGLTVAVLAGELDMSNADDVLARLVAAAADGGRLDVHLGSLTFIDSAGIGVLHRLNRRLLAETSDAGPNRLLVHADPDTVAGRTLRLAGMDQVLPLNGPGGA
jgi:anti-anti-sigma factor